MIKKSFLTAGLAVLLMGTITACGGAETPEGTTVTESTTAAESTTEATTEQGSEDDVDQLAMPAKGDTIATLKIKDYGEIKVRFFPEQAPKAVENFITHAKDGYYDGLTFHRVMDDFMIQGGDPVGNGTGGESIWGEPFEDEFSPALLPIRGSLCMANSGQNTNGSQFFIVQLEEAADNTFDPSNTYSETQIQKFKENGGTPWLKDMHTVFGQVYEGMDVVDKIAETKTDANDKPETDVIIEKIMISEYKG